jgi:hypothetical protein
VAERTTVVCDIHNRDHPATHFDVPVDMCDAAFAKYQVRIGEVQQARNVQRAGYDIEEDNESLLGRMRADPGWARSQYQELLGWDRQRTVNAFNRLKKLGLVRSKGTGSAGRWHVTAAGTKY